MKQLSAKTTVENLLESQREQPVFVSYYSDESHGYYRLSVVQYPIDHETRTKPIFDRLVKQGKLIPARIWSESEHYGPYVLADLDYVSAAITALRQFITDYTQRLERERQDRRDYLAGIDRGWRPDIANWDWLKPMIEDETAIQFAERELVFFLYLKSQGYTTYDPEYSQSRDTYHHSPYAEMRGNKTHLYRKGN